MTAAVIASGSGAWYAVALVAAFLLLAAGAVFLNAIAALPDRWESEVDRQTRARAEALRVLRREGYR